MKGIIDYFKVVQFILVRYEVIGRKIKRKKRIVYEC